MVPSPPKAVIMEYSSLLLAMIIVGMIRRFGIDDGNRMEIFTKDLKMVANAVSLLITPDDG
jgi:hypothetical protein